ncbi:molybdenum cofactor biosynthesis protein MoaE [soil metagenome]
MAVQPATPHDDEIGVTTDPIDPAVMLAAVFDPSCGAVVMFLGMVRDHSPGIDGVTHLEYESYGGVVEERIAEIVAEARSRWPVSRVAAVHRIGELGVGEISVAVAASSPHRADAFEAARYLIDELKHRAPIWKKEHWPGGAEWVREDRRQG